MTNATEDYHDAPVAVRAARAHTKEPVSLVARLARFLQQHPDQWIDGRQLAGVAGAYGWRSRCSDLRRAPFLMTIVNRQVRKKSPIGKPFVVSYYKFVSKPDPTTAGTAATVRE